MYGGVEVSLRHSLPQYWMEISGRVSISTDLLSGKSPVFHFTEESLAPRAGPDVKRREKSLIFPRIEP
jgi:hypothetical protein